MTFELPSNVETIGEIAFFGCYLGGQTLVIPSSVESIGGATFMFTFLKDVDIQEGNLKEIGEAAFYDNKISSFHMPSTVETIGAYCFCWNHLDSLYIVKDGEKVYNTLPSSLSTVNSFALAECSDLTEIHIPSSVTTWSDCVLYNDSSLEAIFVEDGNTILKTGTGDDKYVLFSQDGTTLYQVPDKLRNCSTLRFQYKVPTNVTRIAGGAMAFSTTSKIKSIVLPKNLEEIGDLAFNAYKTSSLSHLTIPANVTTMGQACFPSGCPEIELLGDYDATKIRMKAIKYFSGWMTNNRFDYWGIGINATIYVKKSKYSESIKNGISYGTNTINAVSYKIPITPTKKLTTLCRDFDIQLEDADEADMGSGTNPLTMYIATEKKSDGMVDENGNSYQNYMVMTPITYVPSRTGDDNDDYTGVVVKVDDTSTTYYYEIGENDCYSDNQTTLSQTNYLFGAPCYVYVRMNEAEDGSEGTAYRTLGLHNGIFKWYSKDGIIAEKKAFLRLPASSEAKSFAMKFEDADTVTGITNVNRKDADSEAWYSVQGVRLNGKPTAPGIYIHGNHKVIVK